MIGLSASLFMAGEIATDTQVITILEQMTVSYEISIGTVMTPLRVSLIIFKNLQLKCILRYLIPSIDNLCASLTIDQ
jgi:hypothetical protein